jgi:MFS transporter, putative metabolite:H+ symporter
MSPIQLSARLDRLPLGRFHRRVLLALAVAFLFEFGDLNTFAYVAPALEKHLHLTVDSIAFITSASFLGMFLGAVGGGRFSDAVGRRRALLISVAFFSATSLLNAVMTTVPTLALARFLTGIGLSAMTCSATTYMCEVMPARLRGRMQSAVMSIGLVGIPVMSFTARAIIPLGAGAWRWVFVLGALGMLALPLIARLPESPRWLQQQGEDDRAAVEVDRIERATIADTGSLSPLSLVSDPGPVGVRTGYRALFRRRVGRRTLMLAVVWIFQTLGLFGFVAWVPTLLAAHGFDLVHSLTFSALTTLGAVPGALLAWPLSDRFGRKTPIAVIATAIAACGLAYGLTFDPVAIVVFGFLVNALIQTFAALLFAYTPELFPTEHRNSGTGLVYGVGRLANILGPMVVATIFGDYGYRPVFVYIAGCWAIVALTVAAFGPRTGMQQLEDLDGEEPVAARPVLQDSAIPATG